jgi:hypothetical protein
MLDTMYLHTISCLQNTLIYVRPCRKFVRHLCLRLLRLRKFMASSFHPITLKKHINRNLDRRIGMSTLLGKQIF